MEEYVI